MMEREFILLSELIEKLQSVEDKNVFVEVNREYLLEFDQPLEIEIQDKRVFGTGLEKADIRKIKVLQLEGNCVSGIDEIDVKAQKEKA